MRRRTPRDLESCFPSAWTWLVYRGTAGPGSHHIRASHSSNAEKCAASRFCQVPASISGCRERLQDPQQKQSICTWRLQRHVKKLGSLRATWAAAKEAARLVGSSPHHAHPPLPEDPEAEGICPRQTRGQLRSRRVWGVWSAKSLGEANVRPLDPQTPTESSGVRGAEHEMRACVARAQSSERDAGREMHASRAGKWPGPSTTSTEMADAHQQGGSPVCLSRGPGVPHSQRSAAPTVQGPRSQKEALRVTRNCAWSWGEDGRDSGFLFPGGGRRPSLFFRPRPLPARQGEGRANEGKDYPGGTPAPLCSQDATLGAGGSSCWSLELLPRMWGSSTHLASPSNKADFSSLSCFQIHAGKRGVVFWAAHIPAVWKAREHGRPFLRRG